MTQQTKEITASGVKHFIKADDEFYFQKKKSGIKFSAKPIEVKDGTIETAKAFLKVHPEYKGSETIRVFNKQYVVYNGEIYYSETENLSRVIFLGVKHTREEIIKLIPELIVNNKRWTSLIENGKGKDFLFTPTGKLRYFNADLCIDTSVL